MPTPNQLLHETRWQPHWLMLLLVFAAISAYFAFSPGPPALPSSSLDKLNHLAAFAAMGLAAALAQPAGLRASFTAAAGLLIYGGFIEVVQSLLPTHYADLADLGADALGITLGLLLVATLRRVWGPSVRPLADTVF